MFILDSVALATATQPIATQFAPIAWSVRLSVYRSAKCIVQTGWTDSTSETGRLKLVQSLSLDFIFFP